MADEEIYEHWRELSRQADKASRKEQWGKALKYCGSFLEAVEGQLDPRDLPVLRAKRDYSEALVETGSHDKADKIQNELIEKLESPDGSDEEDVLYDVLYMRDVRAVTLSNLGDIASTEQAKNVLLKVRDLSKKVLGKDDELYSSIRKNMKIINNNLLKLQQEEQTENLRLQKHLIRASAQQPPLQDDEPSSTTGGRLLDHNTQARAPISARVGHVDSFDLGDDQDPARDTSLKPPAPYQSRHDQSLAHQTRGRNLRPISESLTRAPRAASAQPTPSSSDRELRPHRISDAALLSGTSGDLDGADAWFDIELRKSQDLLEMLPPLRSQAGKRPRIAILDTGLNVSHPEVAELYSRRGSEKRIQGGRSWVSSPAPNPRSTDGGYSVEELHESTEGGELPWYEDEDGHGTHCAMVAHRVSPNADIYICRIFKDRNSVGGRHVADVSAVKIHRMIQAQ